MRSNVQLIEQAVHSLLNSARARRTEQGVLVYTKILEMLSSAKDSEEVEGIRQNLNHALSGIEAHGDFTADEFAIVRKLRNST